MTTQQQQAGEYMRNVRWSTAGIVFSSTISVIVAIVWFCSDIKADIKDSRTEAKEQLTAAVTSINRRIDSVQSKNKDEVQSLWLFINGQNPPHKPVTGLYTQKVVNGKIIWVPYK